MDVKCGKKWMHFLAFSVMLWLYILVGNTVVYAQYNNASEAVAYVRKQAVNRVNEIEIEVSADVKKQLDLNNMTDIFAHTGNPKEGDYLKYSVGYKHPTFYSREDGSWIINYYFEYRTTVDQENKIDRIVSQMVQSLQLKSSNVSERDKVLAIYKWLIRNVEYDLGAENQFSAYGALVDKRAVCQGYTMTFYRLCLEAGIDARIISSDSLDHAWNIAKVDGKYYLLDSTWDTEALYLGDYKYFLCGSDDFTGHKNADDQFHNASFSAKYPLAGTKWGEKASGKTDILGHVPKRVLPKIGGGKLTLNTKGKAKVIVFTYNGYNCPYTLALMEKMKNLSYSNVDLIYVEASSDASPQKTVSTFANCKSFTFCQSTDEVCYDAFMDMELESGIKYSFISSPTIFLVNANNEIIYGIHGECDLPDLIEHYLTGAKVPTTIGGTDDGGKHEWKLDTWLLSPTDTESGEAKYVCKKCGKAKYDITPSLKNIIRGQCGDQAFWEYNSVTRKLVISGKGELWDLHYSPNPIGWIDKYTTRHVTTSETYIYRDWVKSVEIKEGITSIGASMFTWFDNLEELIIPGSVRKIGKEAYYILPDAACEVIFLGSAPAEMAKEIAVANKTFYYPADDKTWTVQKRRAFAGKDSKWIPLSCKTAHRWGKAKTITAATTKKTGKRSYTCTVCGTVKTEKIPKIKVIKAGLKIKDTKTNGIYVVLKNKKTVRYTQPISLKAEITIPKTITYGGKTYKVTEIGDNAFKNKKTVISVKIGTNVTVIGNRAFYGSAIAEITIPSKVNKIGRQAFYNCKRLKKITIKTDRLTADNVGAKAFCGTYKKANVAAHKKVLGRYKKLLKAKGMSKGAKYKTVK